MTTAFNKARVLLEVMYAYMVQYRAELILWALAGSLPFILMGAWSQATSTGTFSLDAIEVAQYFISVFVVRQFTVVWVIWEFEVDVNRGNLSGRLLLPLDPVWRYLAEHISERFARIPFSMLLVAFFFVLYPEAFFVPAWTTALACAVATTAAFFVRFAIQYTFSMLSFWTERASSAETLWNLLYLFLSGMIAPLEFFPVAVREAAMWTPFPYLVYVPAKLLTGADVDLARAAVVLAAWGLVFAVANRIAWRAGLKRYSAMGA